VAVVEVDRVELVTVAGLRSWPSTWSTASSSSPSQAFARGRRRLSLVAVDLDDHVELVTVDHVDLVAVVQIDRVELVTLGPVRRTRPAVDVRGRSETCETPAHGVCLCMTL
jgi:hypothetical protein